MKETAYIPSDPNYERFGLSEISERVIFASKCACMKLYGLFVSCSCPAYFTSRLVCVSGKTTHGLKLRAWSKSILA